MHVYTYVCMCLCVRMYVWWIQLVKYVLHFSKTWHSCLNRKHELRTQNGNTYVYITNMSYDSELEHDSWKLFMHACFCVYMYSVYSYVWICRICTFMWAHTHLFVYVCMYVYIYIYIYIHTYIRLDWIYVNV